MGIFRRKGRQGGNGKDSLHSLSCEEKTDFDLYVNDLLQLYDTDRKDVLIGILKKCIPHEEPYAMMIWMDCYRKNGFKFEGLEDRLAVKKIVWVK